MEKELFIKLKKEIKDTWSPEEKSRYIYLKLCEMYTYNLRFSYASSQYKQELINCNTNIDAYKSKEVICTYFVKEIYLKALQEILNIPCDTYGIGHLAAQLSINANTIIADALLGSDISRVKLHLSTINYDYITMNELEKIPYLKNIDNNLNYHYSDSYFQNLALKLEDVYNLANRNKNPNKEDLLIFKFKMAQKFLNSQTTFQGFYDYKFALDYFNRKALNSKEKEIVNFNLLGDGYDAALHFYYLISFSNNYYLISEDNPTLHNITEQDAKNYIDSYRSLKKTI